MFGPKAVAVEAIQTPGLPMYANCPKCSAQNTMKWGCSTTCCNCGLKMTVKKATLRESQFTRTEHGGFSGLQPYEVRK